MRRWLFLLWLAVLLAPAAGLVGPPDRTSAGESRALAQPPAMPSTLEAWRALPEAVDNFVRDQFGLRAELVRANASLRGSLNDDDEANVLEGRNGFLLVREGLAQSMGFDISPSLARRDGALVCEMQRRFERERVSFIYAIAPSPTTIYPEAAPERMGRPSAPTNYDLMIAAAAACGANVLDLRPPLRAQRHAHLLYRRTDTHWTPRGALIAYNTIAARLQRPELQIDTNRIPWRIEQRPGDLARIMGAGDAAREPVDTPDLSQLNSAAAIERTLPTPIEYQAMSTRIRDYPREGPSVLVIGDSFAYLFFPDYLAPFARRVSFIHHQRCAFDWRDVQQAAPDIVIFIPTERYVLCVDGARPAHFDRE